ncbi:MAG TPA: glycoside hydrolase family 15 protein [Ktedonobacterales bacterium]
MGLSEGVRARLSDTDASDPHYWPIATYGVIGDCRTAALLAPNGSMDWLCLPHFDSPAVLLRLLDHDQGGYFQIRPVGACDSLMRFLSGANILETTFTAATGVMRVTDFMPIRKRHARDHIMEALAKLTPSTPHSERAHLERELGNDVASAHRVDRLITCDSGTATARVTLKLTPDYVRATRALTAVPAAQGALAFQSHDATGYYTLVIQPLDAPWTDGVKPEIDLSALATGRIEITAPLTTDKRLAVALSYARNQPEADAALNSPPTHSFDADLRETQRYWTAWSGKMKYDGPYRDLVMRSALTLKLCAFEPTGAIVAAPTTSLPECIGGERNWDYRFSWLRDSSFTLEALGRLGYADEARDYFHFLHDLHLRHGDDIRVLYTIRGETDGTLHENQLSHLEGYMGSSPVRIGNGAVSQRQMDIYGELADAALRYSAAKGYITDNPMRRVPRDLVSLVSRLAEFVCDHWQDLDRGIWEERGPERAFVYSRAMCWVALDRAITVAHDQAPPARLNRWKATAQAIEEEIQTRGYSERLRCYTQAYGVEAADASNLRLVLTGFLPRSNPRVRRAVRVTGTLLADTGPLLYRYLLPESDGQGKDISQTTNDGLRGGEGAFLACAFWYVSSLCLVGRAAEARRRLDALAAYASPLGLFAEEADPTTRALLGNYPQAFTHLAFINAACWLNEAHRGRIHVHESVK